MPALPETVFDQACDIDRIDAWLPDELHVRPEPEDPPGVTVHDDDTGRDERALLRAQDEQLRLEWGTRDDGRYAGWLQVSGIGSGASEVTVHLSFFDEGLAPPDHDVTATLDECLDRLAEQVRMRVDDGG